MQYELINGEYHLFNNGIFVLNAGKKITISYTYSVDTVNKKTMAVIYKHGAYQDVKKLHDHFIEKVSDFARFNNKSLLMAEEQYLVSESFELEEINKMLSICDYIGKYHKKKHGENSKNDLNFDKEKCKLVKKSLLTLV